MHGLLKNKHHDVDPVWHVQLAMLVAIALQLALPDTFSVGSRYLVPVIEALLIIALTFTAPKERFLKPLARRVNAFLLIILTSSANAYALAMVTNQLLKGGRLNNGRELILVAINIYLTNIIIFALWYWELDSGGPIARHREDNAEKDFYFPQQQSELLALNWKPTFIDYLYLSSTNAMAFSPTDTMPLSRRAKMLMLIQSLLSLTAIALVAARAVNILR